MRKTVKLYYNAADQIGPNHGGMPLVGRHDKQGEFRVGYIPARRRSPGMHWVMPALPAALILVAILMPFLSRPARAVQENDPEIQSALALMNQYRSWLGLQPMRIDPALQAAAEAHAEYYRLNYGDPDLAGMGLHMEKPGRPGFTGETMADRAAAHGYKGSVNENVGLSGSILTTLDWFMGTINHRLPIIDPRYTDVGIATVNQDGIVFEIINFGMPQYSEYADPAWVIWPPDGTTGVGLSFWGEAPNPFPGATFPTGLPVTMSYFGEGGISLDSWTVLADGVQVASFGGVGSGFLSGRAALITAASPLEYGTTYTIQASGMAGGEPFSRTWSFTTRHTDDEPMARPGFAPPSAQPTPTPTPEPTPTPTPEPAPVGATAPLDPNSPLPMGLQYSPPSVQSMWWELDGAVYNDETERSWLWGTDTWAFGPERYEDGVDDKRDVFYFDKARVEVDGELAAVDPDELTTGLLVRDMILGAAQVGDEAFIEIGPAQIPLAGDPQEFNPDAPTYASLTGVASVDGDHRASPRSGGAAIETIDRRGNVGVNNRLIGYATYGTYVPTTGHNIASVFEDYFETLPLDWTEAVGLPITEPYWAVVKVEGRDRWVLIQAFERRLLTFTPSNPSGWQVEMGNVGRHYYTWRYGIEPPS